MYSIFENQSTDNRLENGSFGKLPTYSQQFWANSTRPSKHPGSKVKTFFDSPGNVDFENVLIFNPRWLEGQNY